MHMIKILQMDWDRIRKENPSRIGDLLACDLRAECCSLSFNNHRTAWQEKRLQELLATPACSEKEDFVLFLTEKGLKND